MSFPFMGRGAEASGREKKTRQVLAGRHFTDWKVDSLRRF